MPLIQQTEQAKLSAMSTSPNAPQSQLEPIPATFQPKKQRKSTKPAAIKTAVTAKYLIGETKTQIAKDLGIAHNTVNSILNAQEINELVLEGRSKCVQMIPRSVRVMSDRLAKGSETAALAILRGTQVLQNQAVQVNVQNNGAMTWLQVNQAKAENQLDKPVIEATTPASTTTSNSGSTHSTP